MIKFEIKEEEWQREKEWEKNREMISIKRTERKGILGEGQQKERLI